MAKSRLEPSSASARESINDSRNDSSYHDPATSLRAENIAAYKKSDETHARTRGVRKLVLCFDGTGNKFHGDDSDSNILKIFRMLDRTADDQYHYYQRKPPCQGTT